jgi:hypothetical protein
MSGYDAYEVQYRRHLEYDPEEEAEREAWEDERGDRMMRDARMDEVEVGEIEGDPWDNENARPGDGNP